MDRAKQKIYVNRRWLCWEIISTGKCFPIIFPLLLHSHCLMCTGTHPLSYR
jgi:hypothetical protein